MAKKATKKNDATTARCVFGEPTRRDLMAIHAPPPTLRILGHFLGMPADLAETEYSGKEPATDSIADRLRQIPVPDVIEATARYRYAHADAMIRAST